MADNSQFTARTAIVMIDVANPNLNGSGAMAAVITGAENGTSIRNVTIKAQQGTSQGMIRFFIGRDADHTNLVKEVMIPAVTQTDVVPAFAKVVGPPLRRLKLENGSILFASTQIGERFNIVVDAADWEYPT